MEDWFHAANLESVIPRGSWGSQESRLVRNLLRLLDLFDERRVRATLFILGWAARQNSGLIKECASRGHEIACHGPDHKLVYNLTPEQFSAGLRDDKSYLEDLTASPVTGYRAPNFSITLKSWWAVEILAELGFSYDSSVFPFQRERYGVPDAPWGPFRHRLAGSGLLVELPLTIALVAGRPFPIAGGGYFRLLPGLVHRGAVRKLEREGRPMIFYLHPWEIDPGQPRPGGVPLRYRFMHYLNLSTTYARLDRLLQAFECVPLRQIADQYRDSPIWSPLEIQSE